MLAGGTGSSPPLGLDFLRVTQGECRRCLKACLGSKIQSAQMNMAKIQAPLGLITWYLFRNRPFKMWPLEDAIASLLQINPAIYAAITAGAYMSCHDHCELDCPYPFSDARAASEPPLLPELDEVDATDLRFLSQLYHRGRGGGGGGGGGSFSDAISEMFRV